VKQKIKKMLKSQLAPKFERLTKETKF